MCGIVGYTGTKKAAPFLIEGLRALEYRGYDSAGLYAAGAGAIKRAGKVAALAAAVPKDFGGTAGIAHTRWATHGAPTEANAHPHADEAGEFWLVHNGVIENYAELREELMRAGASFKSDTDSEVLAQLIGRACRAGEPLESAIAAALAQVRGTYGIAVMAKNTPDKIVAARLGSPLILGVAEDGLYLASDAAALLPHTRRVVYLEDGEIAVLTPRRYEIRNAKHELVPKTLELLEWNIESAQKKGFEHFMRKEIHEIPEVIENALRGRLRGTEVVLGGLTDVQDRLDSVKRIIITGCGSAYYAGLLGELLIEEFAGIPVEVETASELRYKRFVADSRASLLIAVSQSGETADTLSALRLAKEQGLPTLGVVNVVGSSIARETDAGIYTHAGPEIGVASTKGFVSQVIVLALLARALGHSGPDAYAALASALAELPEKARAVLAREKAIAEVARKYASAPNALFIGRRFHYPVALESALKLKEISYMHAEGYGAGEMKHGPIALIEPGFPTIALAPRDALYEKIASNIEEIRARGGKTIVLTTDGNTEAARLADDLLFVPKTHEAVQPVLSALALELFAYHVARARALPIDQPRNLAKAVTVE